MFDPFEREVIIGWNKQHYDDDDDDSDEQRHNLVNKRPTTIPKTEPATPTAASASNSSTSSANTPKKSPATLSQQQSSLIPSAAATLPLPTETPIPSISITQAKGSTPATRPQIQPTTTTTTTTSTSSTSSTTSSSSKPSLTLRQQLDAWNKEYDLSYVDTPSSPSNKMSDTTTTSVGAQQQQQEQHKDEVRRVPQSKDQQPKQCGIQEEETISRSKQWQMDIRNEVEGFSQVFYNSLPERLKDFHKSSKDRQPLFLTPISSLSPSVSPNVSSPNSLHSSNGSQQLKPDEVAEPSQQSSSEGSSTQSTDDLETNFQAWRKMFNEKMDQRMKITDMRSHGKIQID